MTQLEKNVISTGKSLELEGFSFPPNEQAVWNLVAKGKISERDAVEKILGELPPGFDEE